MLQRTALLSFPPELLQQIAQETSESASPSILRLVCKRFNDVFTPLLFTHISIRYKLGKLEEFLEVLEALADGIHPAIIHAKTVSISYLSPTLEKNKLKLEDKNEELGSYYWYKDLIIQWLTLAISQFKQVTKISWFISSNRSHSWSRDAILSGLAQLQSMEDLDLILDVTNRVSIDINSLPPLRSLWIQHKYGSVKGIPELISKSAGVLRELRINHDYTLYGPNQTIPDYSLHSLFSQASLLHITDLTLEGVHSEFGEDIASHLRFLESFTYKRSAGDPWRMFQDMQIHLRRITLDDPTESFLTYLKSYSTLKALHIKEKKPTSVEQSDRTALDFYRAVLRVQGRSLEVLQIFPKYEGKWCFGDHAAKSLMSLSNLRQLDISIVADTIDKYDYANADEYEYNESHPVCLLLKSAAQLPNLQVLSIGEACVRDPQSRKRGVDVTTQVEQHLESFGPLQQSEYRFVVMIYESKTYYTLQLKDDEFRYRQKNLCT